MGINGNLKQRESLRRLKPYQRLMIAFELHDFARSRVASEIKRANPNITEEELLDRLNKRFIK